MGWVFCAHGVNRLLRAYQIETDDACLGHIRSSTREAVWPHLGSRCWFVITASDSCPYSCLSARGFHLWSRGLSRVGQVTDSWSGSTCIPYQRSSDLYMCAPGFPSMEAPTSYLLVQGTASLSAASFWHLSCFCKEWILEIVLVFLSCRMRLLSKIEL